MRGLSNFGTEPWARDEIVYNQRFRMWSDFSGHFDLAERSPYEHTRVLETEQRQVSYMDRWNNKFLVCADNRTLLCRKRSASAFHPALTFTPLRIAFPRAFC